MEKTFPIRSSAKQFGTFATIQKALIASTVLALFLGGDQIVLLSTMARGFYVSPGRASLSDTLSLITGYLQISLSLLGIIFFWIILWRAYTNVHAFGLEPKPSHRRAIAFWGFFIPFANLFYPYHVVSEVFRAYSAKISGKLATWKLESLPGAVGLWWALWLINGLYQRVLLQKGIGLEHGNNVEALLSSAYLVTVGDVISLFLTIVSLVMVRSLEKAEASALGIPYDPILNEPIDPKKPLSLTESEFNFWNAPLVGAEASGSGKKTDSYSPK